MGLLVPTPVAIQLFGIRYILLCTVTGNGNFKEENISCG